MLCMACGREGADYDGYVGPIHSYGSCLQMDKEAKAEDDCEEAERMDVEDAQEFHKTI